MFELLNVRKKRKASSTKENKVVSVCNDFHLGHNSHCLFWSKLLNADLSSHEGDVGMNFVIVDMRILNILLLKAKCSECRHLTLKLGRQKKEYGLAVKLVLQCTMCGLKGIRFSSPVVAEDTNIMPFEVNVRTRWDIPVIGKGLAALAAFCMCMSFSQAEQATLLHMKSTDETPDHSLYPDGMGS